MSVRLATEADCAEIYRVHEAAIRGLPANTQGKTGVESWLATREPAAYADDMKGELFVVADADGDILGWGAFNAGKQEITNVFVDPPHHRSGIGSAIVKALETAAVDAGCEGIQLHATGTAIDFYRTVGYEPDSPVAQDATWALMKKAL